MVFQKLKILKVTLPNQLAKVVQGSIQPHPVRSRPSGFAGFFANVGNSGRVR